MPRYTSKNIRSNWSEEFLCKAIDNVQNGNSLRNASAEQFKVPWTTLSRRLPSSQVGKLPLGGKPTFNIPIWVVLITRHSENLSGDMGRTKPFLVTKVLKLGSSLLLCIMWVGGRIIAANS